MDFDSCGALSEAKAKWLFNLSKNSSSILGSSGRASTFDHASTAGKDPGAFPTLYVALLIAVLVVLGSYSLLPTWQFIWHIWMTDPLRAIGMFFPLLALAGTLAAWRRIGWAMNGTFWGLPVLALSILLARLTTSLIMVFRVHEHNQAVLHPGVVIFLYGAGAALLFGGPRLLRAAIAPLCLLLLVDPVPHIYNTIVDLPLQFLSANTARHFAHLIGLQPTGEQLRLMFSPDFGMMIVPGCNGVRGSITLGYLALIFGYLRHLRSRTLALTTLSAFLMGYVLNLLRLCTLVIYYRIGLSVPSIQPYGAGVDYAIGCTLFLFATLGIGLFIRWIEPHQTKPNVEEVKRADARKIVFSYAITARTICFIVLAIVFIVPMLGAKSTLHVAVPDENAVLSSFPKEIGTYRLARTYSEHDTDGSLQFAMADYLDGTKSIGVNSKLTLGLYLGPDAHFVAYSKFARGIRPDWLGSFDASDGSMQRALPVHFVMSFYDDGISHEYNAESVCYETGCSASMASSSSKFLFSAPSISNMVFGGKGKRLTILVRREWADGDSAGTANELSQFEADLRKFMQQLNLSTLLQQDGAPI